LAHFLSNTENRLLKLSSDREVFEKHAPHFSKILENSGHPSNLKFSAKNNDPNSPKKRKRPPRHKKVTYFNPPWNIALKSNLGKQFFQLIEDFFENEKSPNYIEDSIISKKTVKFSYSTTGNIKAAFSSHNKKVLNQPKKGKNDEKCHCHTIRKGVPKTCPFPDICNIQNVVYRCDVKHISGPTIGKIKSYLGLTKNKLKERVRKHLASFAVRSSEDATTLSQYVHDLKDCGVEFELKWKIEQRAKSYNGDTCQLCLAEKNQILFFPGRELLNQRTELFEACRHQEPLKFDSQIARKTKK